MFSSLTANTHSASSISHLALATFNLAARPLGNGEDILFSYVAMQETGRLNRVHSISIRELPAPHSIHGRDWKAHIRHRTRLLRALEEQCSKEEL